LGQRLYAKGVDVFNAAELPATEAGTRDPKVIALTLLARTLNSMQAANLLLQNDFTVEARALTRTLLENLFFSAALAKKGEGFIAELELDDITVRRKRAKGLLDLLEKTPERADQHTRLKTYRDQLWEEHGKTSEIRMVDAALAGGVEDAFIAYRELSTDSAHPSATSLSRHVILNEGAREAPFEISALPVAGHADLVDTIELMCMAVLGVIVATNETLGGVEAGERLDDLADTYRMLGTSGTASQNG
jgi:hypothetical protein